VPQIPANGERKEPTMLVFEQGITEAVLHCIVMHVISMSSCTTLHGHEKAECCHVAHEV